MYLWILILPLLGLPLVAQRVKCLPAMRETWVRSLGWEDPLEKEMATHSSTLVWKIPWMEKPGRLQSTGSQRVRHGWATSLSFSLIALVPFSSPLCIWERNRCSKSLNDLPEVSRLVSVKAKFKAKTVFFLMILSYLPLLQCVCIRWGWGWGSTGSSGAGRILFYFAYCSWNWLMIELMMEWFVK